MYVYSSSVFVVVDKKRKGVACESIPKTKFGNTPIFVSEKLPFG